MLRVLLLNANRRGIGTYHRALHFGRQLSLRGFSCTLITVSDQESWRAKKYRENGGLEIIENPNLLDGLLPWHASGPLDVTARLASVVGTKWDVIYAFEYQPNVSIPALFSHYCRNTPLVSDWCDWHAGASYHFGGHKWAHRIDQVCEEFIRHRAERVTVINHLLKSRATGIGIEEKRIAVIREGVDTSYIRPFPKSEARHRLGLPEDIPLIGTIRDSWDGYQLLVDTMSKLARQLPQCKCVHIGRGWASGEALAARVGVGDRMVNTGWVSDDALPLWLAAVDILVLPLKDDLRNRGRWPHKLGDMIAAEKAVIVNPAGEFPELLVNSGAAMAADWDAEALARSVCQLMADTDERHRLAAAGRQFAVRELDWFILGDRVASAVTESIAS